MSYFIFAQGRYTHARWELLETVERQELAKEVYKNYRSRMTRWEVEMVVVEAASIHGANAKLKRKAEPVAGNYPEPTAYDSLGG